MNSINRTTISGRLGRDIDVKYVGDGRALASFSIAVQEGYKKGDAWENRTHWVDCKAWGKAGEALVQDSHKGDELVVDGKITQETWETKDGGKRSRLVIEAQRVIVARPRTAERAVTADNATPPAASEPASASGADADNLPF
jgi:single-strand DNA-binding protein